MPYKHRVNLQENNYAKVWFQKCLLTTLMSHIHAWMHPRKFAAHPQITLFQENSSGGAFLYVKRVIKDLNCKKLFTVVKKKYYHKHTHTHAHKEGPVIGPRSFKKGLRFLHWALLTLNKNLITRDLRRLLGPATRPCYIEQ